MRNLSRFRRLRTTAEDQGAPGERVCVEGALGQSGVRTRAPPRLPLLRVHSLVRTRGAPASVPLLFQKGLQRTEMNRVSPPPATLLPGGLAP